jgi:hypothetical protein
MNTNEKTNRAYWECKLRKDIEYDQDGHIAVEYSWLFQQLIWKHYWGDKLNPEEFSVRYDPNYDQPDLILDEQYRGFLLLRKSDRCGSLENKADVHFAYTVREHRCKGIMSELLKRADKKYKKISLKIPLEKRDFWSKRGFKESSRWIDIRDKITVFLDKYN